jgi:hypothetical protein
MSCTEDARVLHKTEVRTVLEQPGRERVAQAMDGRRCRAP